MFPHAPDLSRQVARFLTLVGVGVTLPLSAEEYLPSIEARATTRVDQRLQRPDKLDFSALNEIKEEEGWDLGVLVEVAYDDNIFLNAINQRGDFVIRVTPKIAYAVGDPVGEEGAYLRAAYLPTAVVYLDNRDDSRIDHDLSWDTGYRGKMLALAYGGYFRRLGDATADVGSQNERNEYGNEARVSWMVSEKVALEAAAGFGGEDYDSAGLADTQRHFGELAWRYAYSPKTQVLIAYRAGREDVDGTGSQDIQRLSVRLRWSPRQKIDVDLEVGGERREYDNGSDTYPVFEGRFGWRPRAGTSLYLGGYRRMEVSSFLQGQNYSLTGAVAGVSQRLGPCWTARLEGGFERASYRRVSGIGPAGRLDNIFFIRPALDYAINEDFRVNVFYQYSQDDSNNPVFGYQNHQAGVGIERNF